MLRNCVVALILIILVSCQSLPIEEELVLAEIEWPRPPDPVQIGIRDSVVYMPLDFWILVVEYIIDVEELRKTYEAME